MMRQYGPMADPQSAARIRDLEQRMAAMPGSRIFVGLAEEYRRAGRFSDALATLRTGLEAHPSYLSARIAVARLYQEMGRDDEAIDAFARVLATDRENLVAAKALGDLYARRGNAVEAVKKYKLYRALAGDRAIDAKIAALERDAKTEPAPPGPSHPSPPPSTAPPAEPRMFDPINFSDSSAEFRFDPNATLALSTLEFSPAPEEGSGSPPETEQTASGAKDGPSPAAPAPVREEPAIPADLAASLSEITLPDFALPGEQSPGPEPPPISGETAGTELAPSAAAVEERELPPAAEAFSEPEPETEAAPRETAPAEGPESVLSPPPELPPSRTLAELYERQGFRDEASRIYERLAAEHPGDESLTRRIAALHEGPAEPPASPPEDDRERKHRTLEAWLSRVKANAAAGARS